MPTITRYDFVLFLRYHIYRYRVSKNGTWDRTRAHCCCAPARRTVLTILYCTRREDVSESDELLQAVSIRDSAIPTPTIRNSQHASETGKSEPQGSANQTEEYVTAGRRLVCEAQIRTREPIYRYMLYLNTCLRQPSLRQDRRLPLHSGTVREFTN